MTEIQTKTKGRKRVIIAAGALLGIAALATSAAFNDYANLNMGANGIGNGAGEPAFNIEVVKTDPATGVQSPGEWQDAKTAAGVPLFIQGSNAIAPGDTISVDIPFRNASAELSAQVTLEIQDIVGGQVSDALMKQNLLYTVTYDGTALVTEKTQAEIAALTDKMSLGLLEAGEEATVKIQIKLKDRGTVVLNNELMDKQAFPQAHFDADSVQPTP